MGVLISPGIVGCPPSASPPAGYTTPWRIDPATGAWWLPVSVAEAKASLRYVSPGNIDTTTGGSLADWITVGNVTVPAWATIARIVVNVFGHVAIISPGNTYNVVAAIGGQETLGLNLTDAGATQRMSFAIADTVALVGSGLQTFKVRAARLGGTGQWRHDTASGVTALIEFQP